MTIRRKSWKQLKYPLTEEWLKNMWYIYTMEYYSAIKKIHLNQFILSYQFSNSVHSHIQPFTSVKHIQHIGFDIFFDKLDIRGGTKNVSLNINTSVMITKRLIKCLYSSITKHILFMQLYVLKITGKQRDGMRFQRLRRIFFMRN